MEKPRLKALYSTEVLGSDKVFLLGEKRQNLVQGDAAVKVLPYLDGRHTVAEIAAAFSAEMSATEVLFAIHKYEVMGHLADGRPDLPDAELAYWDALGVDPALAHSRVDAATVPVLAVGEVDPVPVIEALERAGLRVARVNGPADVRAAAGEPTVVVTRDYLEPGLAAVNAEHLGAGRPWLLVKPDGLSLWLGPLLTPGSSGCWACLAQRLEGNRQIERYLLDKRGDRSPFRTSRAGLPATRATLGAMVAGQVTMLLGAGISALDGRLVTVDSTSGSTEEHILIRQPQCPSCGDPRLMSERDPRIVLESREVAFKADGGYRVQAPTQTFERLSKHISPLLGAVSALALNFDESNGITFSYVAGHNFAAPADNLNLLRRNVRGQSGGKGRTDVQARVSGVCEAIERYSGVWRGDEPSTRLAYDDLGPDRAVHPHELMLFSERQYDEREITNHAPGSMLHLVPERFRTGDAIEWTTAWSLTADRPRLVPTAYMWFGHPDLDEHFYCFGDANGNASGTTMEEAVLQAFCELAERDSVALWWYNRARRPAVDLDAMHDPYVDTLREYYASMGRSLWLLDLTSDLGVPAFTVVSHRIDHPVQDILLGFGAHLDPRLAAMRALTEANQFLPAVEKRDANGATVYREDDVNTLAWWQNATITEEPWLVPDGSVPARKLADMPDLAHDDLAHSVEECLGKVRAAGMEMIVHSQTRPDLELEVAKVLVPGMRHFWRRLGPGRLYDVPARLGWVDAPIAEGALNRHSVFF